MSEKTVGELLGEWYRLDDLAEEACAQMMDAAESVTRETQEEMLELASQYRDARAAEKAAYAAYRDARLAERGMA